MSRNLGLSINGAKWEICLRLMTWGWLISDISISVLRTSLTSQGPERISCIFLLIPGRKSSFFTITLSPFLRMTGSFLLMFLLYIYFSFIISEFWAKDILSSSISLSRSGSQFSFRIQLPRFGCGLF